MQNEHEHLIKYLDVAEALRITIPLKKIAFLASALNLKNFGCEISIKENIATARQIQEKLA